MKKRSDYSEVRSEKPNGFALGFLLGAGLVFLLGTDEGRRLKKKLVQKGRQTIDDLPETVKKIQAEGEELVARTQAVKKQLEEKIDEITPKAKEQLKDALEHIEETQERGRRAAQAAKKRFFTRRGKKVA